VRPEKGICIASLQDLPLPGSKGFVVTFRGETVEGFLVRQKDGVFAYLNRCPHTGAPLDWMPDQFLDADATYIQCAFHGARFEMDTGLCVSGPCVNRRLEQLPVVLKEGKIYFSG
jgi:nitrite reductase/ring-hydroxylating ferredoxin subunit